MIVLNLLCHRDHRFEGWFGSAAAFEEQLERGLVSCPVCGAVDVRRLPSAPYVQTRTPQALPTSSPAATSLPAAAPTAADRAAALLASLRQLARKAEDVGERFPDEARSIHRGHSEPRSIRGAASADELDELLAEGIVVLPVPPEEDLH